MSNDTTIHLLVHSFDHLELACSLAYLRNKDKTWGLDCEEVKYNSEYGYFYRVSGWANENSWNYHITGEGGEIHDLLNRFPNLEIESHYRDEYSAGELDLYEKAGGSKDDDQPMFAFNVCFPSLGQANGWQGHKNADALGWYLFERVLPFYSDGGSVGVDGTKVKLEHSCEADEFLKEELWKELIGFLKRLKAPKDTFLEEDCYYHGHILRKEKVWGEEAKNSSMVSSQEVVEFLNAVDQDENRSPWDMLGHLADFIENDLDYSDQDGNNLFHCAALSGRIGEIQKSELSPQRMLVKNNDGLSVIDLVIESGKIEELPKSMRVGNFEEFHRQSQCLQRLRSNGYHSLADEILANFPNPLIQS